MATLSAAEVDAITGVKVWNAPLVCLGALLRGTASIIASIPGILSSPTVLLSILVSIAVAVAFQDPPASLVPLRDEVASQGAFALYWIVLGVLSSVGLGSGLHTFLLFLGPHIIRVAITASVCDSTSFSAQIVSYLAWRPEYTDDAWDCRVHGDSPVTFWAIVAKVQTACFLWGAGTALGELPPYFVSRSARLTGQVLEELKEVDAAEHQAAPGVIERAKIFVHESVKKFGFGAIFLAASIPNPLFDLAGITCGHFLIPFWTFFGATFLGKAVVKVHIQAFFYIAVFNVHTINWLQEVLPAVVQPLVFKIKEASIASQYNMCYDKHELIKGELLLTSTPEGAVQSGVQAFTKASVEACNTCCGEFFKEQLYREECQEGCGVFGEKKEGLVSQLWGFFIAALLTTFALSILHSLIHQRLVTEATARKAASPTPPVRERSEPSTPVTPSGARKRSRSVKRRSATPKHSGASTPSASTPVPLKTD